MNGTKRPLRPRALPINIRLGDPAPAKTGYPMAGAGRQEAAMSRTRCVARVVRAAVAQTVLVAGLVVVAVTAPEPQEAVAAVPGWTCDQTCRRTFTSDTTLSLAHDPYIEQVDFVASGGDGGDGGAQGGRGGRGAQVSASRPPATWELRIGSRGANGVAGGEGGKGANGAGNGGSSNIGGSGGGGGGATTVRVVGAPQPFLVAAGGGGGGGGAAGGGALGHGADGAHHDRLPWWEVPVAGAPGSCGGGGQAGITYQPRDGDIWEGRGGSGAAGAGGGGGGADSAGTGGYSCAGGAGTGGAFIGGVGGSTSCSGFACLVLAGGGGGGGGSGVQGGGGGGAGRGTLPGQGGGGGGAGSSRGTRSTAPQSSAVVVSFTVTPTLSVSVSPSSPLRTQRVTLSARLTPSSHLYAGRPAGTVRFWDAATGATLCQAGVSNASASCQATAPFADGWSVRGTFRPSNAFRGATAEVAANVADVPQDGVFIRNHDTGEIYRVIGSSLVFVPYCYDTACTSFMDVAPRYIGYLVGGFGGAPGRLQPVPIDGAAMRSVETGAVYVAMSGGLPTRAGTCSDARSCPSAFNIPQSSIDALIARWTPPAQDPPPASFIRNSETGAIYRFVGGSPIYVPYCYENACTAFVNHSPTYVAWLIARRPVPADLVALRSVETHELYIMRGGIPRLEATCVNESTNPHCPHAPRIAQSSIDAMIALGAPPVVGAPPPGSGGGGLSRPPSAEACKRGGWRAFSPDDVKPFRNQGQCVAWARHHR